MIFSILIIISLIVIIGIIVKYYLDKIFIINCFKKGNMIVYGNKGKGKDLVFQKIIEWRKNENYLSNLNYGYNYENIKLKDIDVGNTHHNFIHEELKVVEKQPFECKDIYISDTGVYLPSQHDSTLHKVYPTFPIYYMLSRQLTSNNIHTNVQNIEREWKALRELGDGFIWCKKTIKIFGYLVTFCNYYDRYQTACNKILPIKKPKLTEGRTEYEQFYATNGTIREFFVINRIKNIKYDTRAFHEKLYGYKAK